MREERSLAGIDGRETLADRLRAVRFERYGRDAASLAEQLGIPARTWANYEVGVIMPAKVTLAFLVVTGVEPRWLLTGQGPRYRRREEPGED
jgi:hypothetical protein